MGSTCYSTIFLGIILLALVNPAKAETVQVCQSQSDCEYNQCYIEPEGTRATYVGCFYSAYSGYTVCQQYRWNRDYADEGREWSPCDPGPCKPGRYKYIVAEMIHFCVDCEKGYYLPPDPPEQECQMCPVGKYNDAVAVTSCTECEAGKYQAREKEISCDLCPTGSHQSEQGASICDPCSSGKYQGLEGQMSCQGCPAGSYAGVTGAISSAACMVCPGGTYQPNTGSSHCLECPEGTNGLGVSQTDLSGCGNRKCPKGMYQPETVSITECLDCATGKYNPVDGTVARISSCLDCESGTYSAKLGASVCSLCPPGAYQEDEGKSVCVDCSTGTYASGNGSLSVAECLNCTSGTYSADLGASVCSLCPAGTYQPEDGNSVCLECPMWTAGVLTGQSTVSGCGNPICPPGSFQDQNTMTCRECFTGKYSTGSGGVGESYCLDCIAGSYSDLEGATVCESCLAGTYSSETGLTQATLCSPCPNGTYSTVLYATSAEGCIKCSAGSYSSVAGSECQECAQGKYAPDEGSSVCATCTPSPKVSEWFMSRSCTGTNDSEWEKCSVCSGETPVISRPCSDDMDTECKAINWCVRGVPREQREYSEWMSAEYKCKQGEYLRGFRNASDKDCRQCPRDMVGRNGIYCEWCEGPMEEPYWLDQASCVCKPPAVMTGTGQCVCPDGYRYNARQDDYVQEEACEPCPPNTYGVGGGCQSQCQAGTYSGYAATVCTACPAGKYTSQNATGCQGCQRAGYYAPDPTSDWCEPCNSSCTGVPGWREAGKCPGEGNEAFLVCVPCDKGPLPLNAKWIGTCVLECDPGFYYYNSSGRGECVRCSNEPCPAGYVWSPCTTDMDRGCEEECRNESKPIFHSKWAKAATGPWGACPWECEEGYAVAVSDYWVFQIYECVATSSV